MRGSLNPSQKVNGHFTSAYSQQGSLITNYSAKESNQALPEHSFLTDFSNKSKQHYDNMLHPNFGGTAGVEINEKSRKTLASSSVKEGITTAGSNGRVVKKNLSSEDSMKQEPQSSGQSEVWRSRLFSQDIRQSRSSISDILKAETPTNSCSSTTITLNKNEKSANQLVMKVRDSFGLCRKPRNEYGSQVSSVLNVENNESLEMHGGGKELVVYGKWFDFNDDIVTEISCDSFKNVFRGQECAYMLFYRRTTQDVQSVE
ncbi:hypothetical protein Aperf_G00000044554 [Anoplocephala perfoliata]